MGIAGMSERGTLEAPIGEHQNECELGGGFNPIYSSRGSYTHKKVFPIKGGITIPNIKEFWP